MKTIFIYFLLTIISIPVLTYAQQADVSIKGKLGSYSSPYQLFLISRTDGKWLNDTGEIRNGVFEFKRNIKSPSFAFLFLHKKGNSEHQWDQNIEFVLEPGSIIINSPDTLKQAEVKGGKLNKDFETLKLVNGPIELKQRQIDSAQIAARTNGDSLKIRNAGKMQVSLNTLRKKMWHTFILNHPDSWVDFDVLKSYFKLLDSRQDALDLEYLIHSLSPGLKATENGTYYAGLIDHELLRGIGTVAPDFSRKDTAGHSTSLHDYRGKYVLIDFWASWCAPCRAENPNLMKMYDKYKNNGLNILSISIDKEKESWERAVGEDQLKWKQILDNPDGGKSVADLYYIESIPHNFLVDPNGIIVSKDLRGDDLDTKLSEIFHTE